MASKHYDAVVIGAGQGGGPLASALARSGRRTALVEREYVGGTCINVGCTPTKTMIASARTAEIARRAEQYGVETGPVRVDMRAVRERKRSIVASFRASSEKKIEETPGLDLLRGEARFRDAKALVVETADGEIGLNTEIVIIDAGTRPATPSLPGIDGVRVHDSTSIMELDETPAHLLVLGGGYVGLEFSQMFRRIGSGVTVIQRGPRLLGREDDDVADALAEILREDGIDIRFNAEAVSVTPGSDGDVRLTIRGADRDEDLAGTHLLVATGRTPNTDRLNLASAGVETDDRGFIRVDDRLATNVPGIYAIGDITGGPAFTHVSYDDYRVLCTNLIEGGAATTRDRLIPYVVFTDPQLGRVGMTESEAKKRGLEPRVARLSMDQVARAIEVGETRGFLKAVVARDSDEILGFTALCLEGGELMAAIQVAMMGKVPYTALRDGIFAHPTLAESFNNLFSSLDA